MKRHLVIIAAALLSAIPASAKEFVCQAGWYGEAFQGKRTANGEIFDKWKYTAASKTIPLGSYILITNLRNGKSVVARVNDRGPYRPTKRKLDVSLAVALKLGFFDSGVAWVRIKVL